MSNLPEFDYGDAPRSFNEFRNFAGVLADPQTVKVSIKKPDGTITTKIYGTDGEVIKESTGVYRIDVDANAEGVWSIRWFAEGTGKASSEMRFRVKDSDFV